MFLILFFLFCCCPLNVFCASSAAAMQPMSSVNEPQKQKIISALFQSFFNISNNTDQHASSSLLPDDLEPKPSRARVKAFLIETPWYYLCKHAGQLVVPVQYPTTKYVCQSMNVITADVISHIQTDVIPFLEDWASQHLLLPDQEKRTNQGINSYSYLGVDRRHGFCQNLLTTIPPEHIVGSGNGFSTKEDYRKGESSEGNSGVNQAYDLVFYVTTMFTLHGGLDAYPCQFHPVTNRPTIIHFNVAGDAFIKGYLDDRQRGGDMGPADVATLIHRRMLHELVHSMGMLRFMTDHTPTYFSTVRNQSTSTPALNQVLPSLTSFRTDHNWMAPLAKAGYRGYLYQQERKDVLRRYLRPEGVTTDQFKWKSIVDYVRNHFGCSTALGADLENIGSQSSIVNAHWDARTFLLELNSLYFVASELRVTNLTYELLSATGWFNIDRTLAMVEFNPYGANTGCSFLKNRCNELTYQHPPAGHQWETETEIVNGTNVTRAVLVVDNITSLEGSYYSNATLRHNEVCFQENDRFCSADHRAVATCALYHHYYGIPQNMRYFSNPNIGGETPYNDYCPLLNGNMSYCTRNTLEYWNSYCFDAASSEEVFVRTNSEAAGVKRKVPFLSRISGASHCFHVVNCHRNASWTSYDVVDGASSSFVGRCEELNTPYLEIGQNKGKEDPPTFLAKNGVRFVCPRFQSVCSSYFQKNTHILPTSDLMYPNYTTIEDVMMTRFESLDIRYLNKSDAIPAHIDPVLVTDPAGAVKSSSPYMSWSSLSYQVTFSLHQTGIVRYGGFLLMDFPSTEDILQPSLDCRHGYDDSHHHQKTVYVFQHPSDKSFGKRKGSYSLAILFPYAITASRMHQFTLHNCSFSVPLFNGQLPTRTNPFVEPVYAGDPGMYPSVSLFSIFSSHSVYNLTTKKYDDFLRSNFTELLNSNPNIFSSLTEEGEKNLKQLHNNFFIQKIATKTNFNPNGDDVQPHVANSFFSVMNTNRSGFDVQTSLPALVAMLHGLCVASARGSSGTLVSLIVSDYGTDVQGFDVQLSVAAPSRSNTFSLVSISLALDLHDIQFDPSKPMHTLPSMSNFYFFESKNVDDDDDGVRYSTGRPFHAEAIGTCRISLSADFPFQAMKIPIEYYFVPNTISNASLSHPPFYPENSNYVFPTIMVSLPAPWECSSIQFTIPQLKYFALRVASPADPVGTGEAPKIPSLSTFVSFSRRSTNRNFCMKAIQPGWNLKLTTTNRADVGFKVIPLSISYTSVLTNIYLEMSLPMSSVGTRLPNYDIVVEFPASNYYRDRMYRHPFYNISGFITNCIGSRLYGSWEHQRVQINVIQLPQYPKTGANCVPIDNRIGILLKGFTTPSVMGDPGEYPVVFVYNSEQKRTVVRITKPNPPTDNIGGFTCTKCNSRGTCTSNSAAAPCTCFLGYGGPSCSVCAYHNMSIPGGEKCEESCDVDSTFMAYFSPKLHLWRDGCLNIGGYLNPQDQCRCYCKGQLCLMPTLTLSETLTLPLEMHSVADYWFIATIQVPLNAFNETFFVDFIVNFVQQPYGSSYSEQRDRIQKSFALSNINVTGLCKGSSIGNPQEANECNVKTPENTRRTSLIWFRFQDLTSSVDPSTLESDYLYLKRWFLHFNERHSEFTGPLNMTDLVAYPFSVTTTTEPPMTTPLWTTLSPPSSTMRSNEPTGPITLAPTDIYSLYPTHHPTSTSTDAPSVPISSYPVESSPLPSSSASSSPNPTMDLTTFPSQSNNPNNVTAPGFTSPAPTVTSVPPATTSNGPSFSSTVAASTPTHKSTTTPIPTSTMGLTTVPSVSVPLVVSMSVNLLNPSADNKIDVNSLEHGLRLSMKVNDSFLDPELCQSSRGVNITQAAQQLIDKMETESTKGVLKVTNAHCPAGQSSVVIDLGPIYLSQMPLASTQMKLLSFPANSQEARQWLAPLLIDLPANISGIEFNVESSALVSADNDGSINGAASALLLHLEPTSEIASSLEIVRMIRSIASIYNFGTSLLLKASAFGVLDVQLLATVMYTAKHCEGIDSFWSAVSDSLSSFSLAPGTEHFAFSPLVSFFAIGSVLVFSVGLLWIFSDAHVRSSANTSLRLFSSGGFPARIFLLVAFMSPLVSFSTAAFVYYVSRQLAYVQMTFIFGVINWVFIGGFFFMFPWKHTGASYEKYDFSIRQFKHRQQLPWRERRNASDTATDVQVGQQCLLNWYPARLLPRGYWVAQEGAHAKRHLPLFNTLGERVPQIITLIIVQMIGLPALLGISVATSGSYLFFSVIFSVVLFLMTTFFSHCRRYVTLSTFHGWNHLGHLGYMATVLSSISLAGHDGITALSSQKSLVGPGLMTAAVIFLDVLVQIILPTLCLLEQRFVVPVLGKLEKVLRDELHQDTYFEMFRFLLPEDPGFENNNRMRNDRNTNLIIGRGDDSQQTPLRARAPTTTTAIPVSSPLVQPRTPLEQFSPTSTLQEDLDAIFGRRYHNAGRQVHSTVTTSPRRTNATSINGVDAVQIPVPVASPVINANVVTTGSVIHRPTPATSTDTKSEEVEIIVVEKPAKEQPAQLSATSGDPESTPQATSTSTTAQCHPSAPPPASQHALAQQRYAVRDAIPDIMEVDDVLNLDEDMSWNR